MGNFCAYNFQPSLKEKRQGVTIGVIKAQGMFSISTSHTMSNYDKIMTVMCLLLRWAICIQS